MKRLLRTPKKSYFRLILSALFFLQPTGQSWIQAAKVTRPSGSLSKGSLGNSNPPAPLGSVLASLPSVAIEKTIPPEKKGRGWVIHLKDFHGAVEAQEKISEGLAGLVNAGIQGEIFLEGTGEDLDFSGLAQVQAQSPKAWADTVKSLFQQGHISGPVYLALAEPSQNLTFLGLEEELPYVLNLKAMADAETLRPVLQNKLKNLSDWNLENKKKFLEPSLFVIDTALQRFKKGDLSPASLALLLKGQGASLSPMVRSFLFLIGYEESFNKDDLARDLKKAGEELKGDLSRLPLSDYPALEDMGVFLSRVLAGLRARGAGLDRFPALVRAARYQEALGELGPGLARNIEVDAMKFLFSQAKTLEAKASVFQSMALSNLSLLLKLELTPGDLLELTPLLDNIKTEDLSPVLGLQSEISSILNQAAPFLDFYRYAKIRDQVFSRRLAAFSQKHPSSNVTIVAGGFHGEGLEGEARASGMGYISLIPAVSWNTLQDLKEGTSWDPHVKGLLKIMSRETLAPDPFSYEARQILSSEFPLFPSRFNDRENLGAMKTPADLLDPAGASSEMGKEVNTPKGVEYVYSSLPFLHKIFPQIVPDGVKVTGRTLHLDQVATVTIFPRQDKRGIRFIKKTKNGPLEIPAILENAVVDRRRYNGIGKDGHEIITVEHLMVALEMVGILDAEIYLEGDEIPILDGSAKLWFEVLHHIKFRAEKRKGPLRWLARAMGRWDPLSSYEKPVPLRMEWPGGFVRSRTTAVVALSGVEDKDKLLITAVPNLPTLDQQGFPYEKTFEIFWSEPEMSRDFERIIAWNPTFVERDLAELQKQGFYKGGRAEGPDKNLLEAHKPGAVAPGGLPAHKILDFLGDLALLHQSLRQSLKKNYKLAGRVAALGAGHRDHNLFSEILNRALLKETNIHPFPFGPLDSSLDSQKRNKSLSETLYAAIKMASAEQFVSELKQEHAEYKGLDPLYADEASIEILGSVNGWSVPWILAEEDEEAWPLSQDNMRVLLKEYFGMDSGKKSGRPLRLILKQLFPDIDVSSLNGVKVWLWEESYREGLFKVELSLQPSHGEEIKKEIGLVVGKFIGDKRTLTKREILRELSTNLNSSWREKKRKDASSPMPLLPPRAGLFDFIPSKKIWDSNKEDDLSAIGVFAREWIDEGGGFGISRPLAELLGGKVAEPLEFGFITSSLDARTFNPITREQDLAIASQFGALMTRLYVRFFQGTQKKGPGVNGYMPIDVQFQRDFVVHPAHKNNIPAPKIQSILGMSTVKNYRRVPIERFLADILNENVNVIFQEDGVYKWREWAVFARLNKEGKPDPAFFNAVLDGIESELIEQYGPIVGRREAMMMYSFYLSAVKSDPIFSSLEAEKGDLFQTYVMRQYIITDLKRLEKIPDSNAAEIPGPHLKGLILAREKKVGRELDELSRSGPKTPPPASAEWIVKLGRLLWGGSDRDWIRLAPWTELVFSMPFLTFSSWGASVGGGKYYWAAGAAAVMVFWALSHRKIFDWNEGRWIHPAELDEAQARKNWFRERRKIWALGAVIAGLPFAAGTFNQAVWIFPAVAASVLFHVQIQRRSEAPSSGAAPYWNGLWRGKLKGLRSL